jgi:hypothetical protein
VGAEGRYGRVRKISPPLRFDPRTVQPVGSRYTDCAIPAQVYLLLQFYFDIAFIFPFSLILPFYSLFLGPLNATLSASHHCVTQCIMKLPPKRISDCGPIKVCLSTATAAAPSRTEFEQQAPFLFRIILRATRESHFLTDLTSSLL